MKYIDIDNAIPDNTEVFVGITMVKQNGEFVVKSQFCKVQGDYTAKKTGTKREQAIKKESKLNDLKDMQLGQEEW